MGLNWYCTGATGMKQQSCRGILWFFKVPQVILLEKQRNRHHEIGCLITNTWANRVAIVSSVITRYSTLAKQWTVTIQLAVFLCPVHQLIIFIASLSAIIYQLLFDSQSFNSVLFCSICFVRLFSVWLIDFSKLFSVLKLELFPRYFYPHDNITPYRQPSGKSVNIIQYTRLCHLLS